MCLARAGFWPGSGILATTDGGHSLVVWPRGTRLEDYFSSDSENSQKQRLQSGLPDAPRMAEVQNSFAGLKTDNLELRPLQARDAAQLFLFRGSDTEAVWRDRLMGGLFMGLWVSFAPSRVKGGRVFWAGAEECTAISTGRRALKQVQPLAERFASQRLWAGHLEEQGGVDVQSQKLVRRRCLQQGTPWSCCTRRECICAAKPVLQVADRSQLETGEVPIALQRENREEAESHLGIWELPSVSFSSHFSLPGPRCAGRNAVAVGVLPRPFHYQSQRAAEADVFPLHFVRSGLINCNNITCSCCITAQCYFLDLVHGGILMRYMSVKTYNL